MVFHDSAATGRGAAYRRRRAAGAAIWRALSDPRRSFACLVWRSRSEIEPTLIETAIEAGDAVRRPGFDIAFDRIQTFAGDSRSRTGGRSIVPTVLICSNGAREVLALYTDLRREMQRLCMGVGSRSFVPHLTIWYGPERVPDFMLKRPFRWPVRKFWLVHTTKGRKLPDYVGEWSLG